VTDTVRITFDPGGSFEVPLGRTLFDAAVLAGVEVDTVCGGQGTCGKCRVRFPNDPPSVRSIDTVHLSAAETAAGWRLSCQVRAERDVDVEVPPAGDRQKVRIVHEGVHRDVPLQPNIRKIFVPFVPPRTRDGVADWDHVLAGLPRSYRGLAIALDLLRRLPEMIRLPQGMTVVLEGRHVVAIEAGDTTPRSYGVAVDLGSTTVVAFLVDLTTGEEVSVASALNRQSAFGDDLVARLARAQFDPEGLATLHRMIVEQLGDLILAATRDAGVDPFDIDEVVAVGNMAMHHFLLGLDSTYLGLSPYAPVVRGRVSASAAEIGISVLDPATPVYVMPNIAGFVGSDTVAVALAAELATSEAIRLAADVGTNGEILLGSRARLIACSAPAGPAFEGARISQGMRAAAGAIDHVSIDRDVEVAVIGDDPARGICGSALIDITAGLLEAGLLDESGKLLRAANLSPSVPTALVDRVLEGASQKESAFLLVRAGESGAERDIVLTQQDIREFQLAKGAIRAGASVLQGVMGLRDSDLDEVLLAGAFGTYLDLENARRVNLVPWVPLDRLRSIGNAAGVGARLALLSTKERAAAERIGRGTEHIRLSGLDEFQRAFVKAMRFPAPSTASSSDRRTHPPEEVT
jgi:uncharacterized 2Fe-2S/4Fe-4S cluster protein (DUF4445 family)